MTPDEQKVFALLCDLQGRVVRIVRDELGLADRVPPGAPVGDLVTAEHAQPLRGFVDELLSRSVAYDWKIDVPVGGKMRNLHFVGARAGDELLIVAAPSQHALARVSEELMRINNEQTNALRSALKDLAMAAKQRPRREDALYEELSRVNNDLANLQREMAGKNAELGRLNEQKDRLLGMAAHDLRSPLGVILSYSEFLETEAVLDAEQLEFVAEIKDASEFMLRLVDDLLDVSQIESGRLNLNLDTTDLVQLVRRNLALNGVLASRKAILLECSPPQSPIEMALDARKIEQVLNNLIGNAVKFSHSGTTVQVRITRDARFATVAVQDRGQGIPQSDLPKLFKPFSTASVRGTAGEKSTGLGLAIVRRIVEGHGGRVGVESKVGAGSTFFFALPLGGA